MPQENRIVSDGFLEIDGENVISEILKNIEVHPDPMVRQKRLWARVLILAVDDLVSEGKHPNRSEAIRVAIRDMIKGEFPDFESKRHKKRGPRLKERMKA